MATRKRMPILSLLSVLLLAGTLVYQWAVPGSASHDIGYWTAVGSTGTVDEADLGIVSLDTYTASIAAGAALPATVNIRYNVTVTGAMFHVGDGPLLMMRFRDNSSTAARVVARLRELNTATGAGVVRMVLDSNSFTASSSFQEQYTFNCSPSWAFNFDTNVYEVDVEITRSASGGTPAIQALRIGRVLC